MERPPCRGEVVTEIPQSFHQCGEQTGDQAAPASTRVRAAECIINHAAKAIEIEDIEARVSELERTAEGQKRK